MKSGEDIELVYRALRRRMKFVYDRTHWSITTTGCPWHSTRHWRGATFSAAPPCSPSLHLDGIAFTELARTGYYILRNRKGAGRIPKALGGFLIGCARGVGYLLASPPKLTECADPAERG